MIASMMPLTPQYGVANLQNTAMLNIAPFDLMLAGETPTEGAVKPIADTNIAPVDRANTPNTPLNAVNFLAATDPKPVDSTNDDPAAPEDSQAENQIIRDGVTLVSVAPIIPPPAQAAQPNAGAEQAALAQYTPAISPKQRANISDTPTPTSTSTSTKTRVLMGDGSRNADTDINRAHPARIAADGIAPDLFEKAVTPQLPVLSGTGMDIKSNLAPVHASLSSPGNLLADHHLNLASDSRWLDTLAKDIVAAHSNSDQLSFRLSPPNLGRLDIKLTAHETGLALHMATTNDEAAKIVGSANPRLVDDLRAQGLRITSSDVTSHSNTASDHQARPQFSWLAIEHEIPSHTHDIANPREIRAGKWA